MIDANRLSRLKELAAQGRPASEIARTLGTSRQNVYSLCQHYDIKLQPYHEFMRQRSLEFVGPARAEPRLITGGVLQKTSTGVAGRVAELLVAADLVARGWEVFMALNMRAQGHDLVASRNGHLVSIEVRSARRNKVGTLKYGKKSSDNSMIYALVVTGEPVTYVPDLPD